MAEGFHAVPEQIAGYGVLVDTVSKQLSGIQQYVAENAKAGPGFDGLVMSLIKAPVDTYALETSKRILSHGNHLVDTGTELKRTAWDYSGADKSAYQIFADDGISNPNVPPQVTGYKDFPDPVSYPAGSDPAAALKPPEIAEADIQSKVDEVGGSLKVIDWAVSQVTGWSPVEAITEPISGNWNSLKASGEALKNAGTALEESLDNLTKALPTLDPHWNGGAAQDFHGYITKLVNGAGQEGPLNRIVGGVYDLVADQIEKVAQFVVDKLKHVVDQILEKLATGWIPFIGWARLIDFIKECVGIFQQAREMVNTVQELVENAKQLIEIAQDPVGAAQEAIEEKLQPIEEQVDRYQRGAEVAKNLADVADTQAWEDSPDQGYTSIPGNADPRRPGA
ncbi:MAG: hypothetical protein GEU98_07885 [Pseudonocardiaceae bacterium]|nr:hypothetical protein [Pseudonocardiaceae bacterium]